MHPKIKLAVSQKLINNLGQPINFSVGEMASRSVVFLFLFSVFLCR